MVACRKIKYAAFSIKHESWQTAQRWWHLTGEALCNFHKNPSLSKAVDNISQITFGVLNFMVNYLCNACQKRFGSKWSGTCWSGPQIILRFSLFEPGEKRSSRPGWEVLLLWVTPGAASAPHQLGWRDDDSLAVTRSPSYSDRLEKSLLMCLIIPSDNCNPVTEQLQAFVFCVLLIISRIINKRRIREVWVINKL